MRSHFFLIIDCCLLGLGWPVVIFLVLSYFLVVHVFCYECDQNCCVLQNAHLNTRCSPCCWGHRGNLKVNDVFVKKNWSLCSIPCHSSMEMWLIRGTLNIWNNSYLFIFIAGFLRFMESQLLVNGLFMQLCSWLWIRDSKSSNPDFWCMINKRSCLSVT